MKKYLVFHDGSFVSAEALKIDQAISDADKFGRKKIELNGSVYQLPVFKILDEQQFYDQYPQHRQEVREAFEIDDVRFQNMTPEEIEASNQRRHEGLLRGLKQFIHERIESGESYENAKAIYVAALKKGTVNTNEAVQVMSR